MSQARGSSRRLYALVRWVYLIDCLRLPVWNISALGKLQGSYFCLLTVEGPGFPGVHYLSASFYFFTYPEGISKTLGGINSALMTLTSLVRENNISFSLGMKVQFTTDRMG